MAALAYLLVALATIRGVLPAPDVRMLRLTGMPPRVAEVARRDTKFPGLVIELTPYVMLEAVYQAEAHYFVSRGYNALVCTLRGTGRSGGAWQHAMSSQDGRDAHDLVEWLAVQPFSDGRIGQFGESYGGATSYGAAVERAVHLRAIAPLQPPGDLYRDVVYPGGIKATERGALDNWPPSLRLPGFGPNT
jgi:putative CocE/NonD family hydrolase